MYDYSYSVGNSGLHSISWLTSFSAYLGKFSLGNAQVCFSIVIQVSISRFWSYGDEKILTLSQADIIPYPLNRYITPLNSSSSYEFPSQWRLLTALEFPSIHLVPMKCAF